MSSLGGGLGWPLYAHRNLGKRSMFAKYASMAFGKRNGDPSKILYGLSGLGLGKRGDDKTKIFYGYSGLGLGKRPGPRKGDGQPRTGGLGWSSYSSRIGLGKRNLMDSYASMAFGKRSEDLIKIPYGFYGLGLGREWGLYT